MAARLLSAGALLGVTGVVLGALGAHGGALSESSSWDTAVHYQLIHAVVLVALGLVHNEVQSLSKAYLVAGWLMVAGVLLFSGSIYLLVLGGPSWLGPVTPLGGVCFIVGWVTLLWASFSVRK